MKNWKINIAGYAATALVLVACGGGVSVKKDESVPSNSEKTVATPAKSGGVESGRFVGMTNAHNSARSKHNSPPLAWSDSLASYAQEWANELGDNRNCKMDHRPRSGKFKQLHGENLFWGSAKMWSDGRREVQEVSVDDVVGDWVKEVKDYNHASNSCKPGAVCGHYTQVVWKDTTEVGCGFKQCSDKSQLWVCNYSPAGNIIGQKPY